MHYKKEEWLNGSKQVNKGYETKIICIIKHDCQTQLQSVIQTPCKVHYKSMIVTSQPLICSCKP